MKKFSEFLLESTHSVKTATIALFRKKDGNLQVLIGSKRDDNGKKIWVLPGGRQEKNENLTDTARRELREETGIYFSGKLEYIDRDDRHICFAGFSDNLVQKSKSGGDLDSAKWVSIDELPKFAFNHGEWIKESRKKLQI